MLHLLHCDFLSLLGVVGLSGLLVCLQVEKFPHMEGGDDYLSFGAALDSVAGGDFTVGAAGPSPGDDDTLVWLGALGRHLGQVARWRRILPIKVVDDPPLRCLVVPAIVATLFADYAVVDAHG